MTLRAFTLAATAVACAAATLFFGVFGVRLIYAALTFRGEGSLGHVGMAIAAFVFPLLAVFFGGCSYLAWRRLRAPP